MKKRKTFVDVLAEEGLFSPEMLAEYLPESQQRDISLSNYLVGNRLITRTILEGVLQRRKFDILLGDLLVETGVIAVPSQINQALTYHQEKKVPLGESLIRLGFIERSRLMELLCRQVGIVKIIPEVELAHSFEPMPSDKFQQNNLLLPYFREDKIITVLMSDPFDSAIIEQLEKFYNDLTLNIAYADSDDLRTFFNFRKVVVGEDGRALKGRSVDLDFYSLESLAGDDASQEGLADSVRIVQLYLKRALEMGASDIHFEPLDNSLRVRFAIDGILYTITHFPKTMAPRIAGLLKAASGIDVAQHRMPGDGRMVVRSNHKEYGVRISTYPSLYGENCVLRLLRHDEAPDTIDSLGLTPRNLKVFHRSLDTPSGVVFVTGPTGSGKTTTLYTALRHLSSDDNRHIITIEDPIEYTLAGATQGAVNEKIGFSYLVALASIMRQNPDIIMVGELRDKHCAEAIIQAALTGHKVFSTFHTETANGALSRLLDMGMENFLILETVELVIAQRLIREICPVCADEYVPAEQVLKVFEQQVSDLAGVTLKRGSGVFEGKSCANCNGSGFRGRTAIHEFLQVNGEVARAVGQGKPSWEIREIAKERGGFISLREDGVYKALRGITTLEEVLRVVPDTDESVRSFARIVELCEASEAAPPCDHALFAWGREELQAAIAKGGSMPSADEDLAVVKKKLILAGLPLVSLLTIEALVDATSASSDEAQSLMRAFFDVGHHCKGPMEDEGKCKRCLQLERIMAPELASLDDKYAHLLAIDDRHAYFLNRQGLAMESSWEIVALMPIDKSLPLAAD